MSTDITCSQCHGQFTIDSPGPFVVCPHCGAQTITSSPPELPHSDEHHSEGDSSSSPIPDSPTMIANGMFTENDSVEISIRPPLDDEEPDFSWMSATTPPTPADASPRFIDAPYTLPKGEDETPEFIQDSRDSFDGVGIEATNLHFEPSGDSAEAVTSKPVASIVNEPVVSPKVELQQHSFPAQPQPGESQPSPVAAALPEPSVSERAHSLAKDDANSRQSFLTMLLIVVGTYASLVTMYLIYSILNGRAHQLESLPDLKTVQQLGGKVQIPEPRNMLPPGHQLRLGQSARFGDIRVTPLRVTKGPLTFTHYTGDPARERSPTEPVLKLWLKFENMSASKTITPLDTTLMFFHRALDSRTVAFNVIFREGDVKDVESYRYHFDRIAADSEWLIKGQNANRALGPHESYETFVPSQEDLNGLAPEIVWRVHFRKGIGAKTGNGVTTLIDVHFSDTQIEPDPV